MTPTGSRGSVLYIAAAPGKGDTAWNDSSGFASLVQLALVRVI
jgi:hypothetical protein